MKADVEADTEGEAAVEWLERGPAALSRMPSVGEAWRGVAAAAAFSKGVAAVRADSSPSVAPCFEGSVKAS